MVAPVTKKSLPVTDADDQPLGRDTIMDPGLAASHGVQYVHLAAFAIDVDRVRELTDADPDGVWPFGWEVFLTEIYLLGTLDPEHDESRQLLDDLCLGILDIGPGEPPLGAQIPFAVYDAVRRGQWPAELGALFASWKNTPDDLIAELDPLWQEPEAEAADLALACLEASIVPPLSPPTIATLQAIVEAQREDDPEPAISDETATESVSESAEEPEAE